jgi:hypothetical protein
LRFLITDILKYTENKIRGYLGVRSKLTVYALPIPIRELIDERTLELLPKRVTTEQRRQKEEEASYAALYDIPKTPLSLSHATEIEQDSWDTTQKLVDAFEEEKTEEAMSVPMPQIEKTAYVPTENELSDLLLPYRDFLNAVLREDLSGQKAAAKERGKLLDAVAEEINELASDAMGDVLLEDGDDGYRVIDEYKALLSDGE